jgi:wyosine [tRNA(Phe)-imidazoG37] synthetase (radical SAM superfamily)
MQSKRSEFYHPTDLCREVVKRVAEVRKDNERIDYITFVPDGEPTLDINLGKEIFKLKELGIKIAVISNGSLMWRNDVKNDLQSADWVSIKVDAVSEALWRLVNRPHKSLRHESILKGIRDFAKKYDGELATETMLIQGINDGLEEADKTSDFIDDINPDKAYIAIPTRPPAEDWVKPPEESVINQTYQVFKEKIKHVEHLIGYEGNAFSSTGNIERDLLNITSVHPMREEAVNELLDKTGSNWHSIEELIENGKLKETEYRGNKFYMRKLVNSYRG